MPQSSEDDLLKFDPATTISDFDENDFFLWFKKHALNNMDGLTYQHFYNKAICEVLDDLEACQKKKLSVLSYTLDESLTKSHKHEVYSMPNSLA